MNTVFKWEGLPDEIEGWMIENLLFFRGECAFWKLGDKFVVTPNVKVDWDLYGLTTIANPVQWNGKGPDGSVVLHTSDVNPIKGKYKEIAVFIRNNLNKSATLTPVISLLQFLQGRWVELNLDRLNSRNLNLLTTTTKKIAKTIKKEMNAVYDNDEPFAVISQGAADIISTITKLNPNNTPRSISLWDDITKAKQEINEMIGIPFDSRPEKKERVISQEVNISQIQVNEVLEGMLNFRKRAVEKINNEFGLNITVQLDEKVEAAFDDEGDNNEGQKNTQTDQMDPTRQKPLQNGTNKNNEKTNKGNNK